MRWIRRSSLFKEQIEELHRAGVISGPLTSESARGWIHNVVITQKSIYPKSESDPGHVTT